MVNQYYEYQYVQAHVSEDLPFKYIFSAFWEAGSSFLLWMFWHVILGLVLMVPPGSGSPTLSGAVAHSAVHRFHAAGHLRQASATNPPAWATIR